MLKRKASEGSTFSDTDIILLIFLCYYISKSLANIRIKLKIFEVSFYDIRSRLQIFELS
jgi:hypothetical protein